MRATVAGPTRSTTGAGRSAMALFMDRHDLSGATPAQIAEAHTCDLLLQDKHQVRFITYWHHAGAGTSFCLVEAASAEAAEAVHLQAHGNVANQVIEVDQRSVEGFLGRIREPATGEIWEDVATRAIVCAEVVEPPALRERDREDGPLRSRRLVSQAALKRGGVPVAGHRGVMGCFASVNGALECALALQESLAPLATLYEGSPMRMRIGVSAGEPVDGTWGLFGRVMETASRLCDLAEPGTTLVGEDVFEQAAEGRFRFSPAGMVEVAGVRDHKYRLEGRSDGGTTAAKAEAPAGLSARQVEVLTMIANGKTNREIARGLYITEATVATHIRNIFERAGVANRAEAASFAHRHGLL